MLGVASQNQALSALVFLYREVLSTPVVDIPGVQWAKRRDRIPVVNLMQVRVEKVLTSLAGMPSGADLDLKKHVNSTTLEQNNAR
jgi:hypothetical protein